MFAEEEADHLLARAVDQNELETLLARRVAGEPLEQVVGWVDIAGLRLRVGPGVFVPRRRSTLLIDLAVQAATQREVIVELCCGVAPVAAAVAAAHPRVRVYAGDVDAAALEYARLNVPTGVVVLSDLFAGVDPALRGRVDVLAVSAPYVPSTHLDTMPRQAREHEPVRALDGGSDGLTVYRRMLAEASPWLSPTGTMLLECARHQAPALSDDVTSAGFRPGLRTCDDLDATVVLARRR